jgi:hypothetical protein
VAILESLKIIIFYDRIKLKGQKSIPIRPVYLKKTVLMQDSSVIRDAGGIGAANLKP